MALTPLGREEKSLEKSIKGYKPYGQTIVFHFYLDPRWQWKINPFLGIKMVVWPLS
jgi:hypothetical protein